MDSLGHPDGNLVTLTLTAAARTNKYWREELLTVKPDRVKHQRFYIENIECQKKKSCSRSQDRNIDIRKYKTIDRVLTSKLVPYSDCEIYVNLLLQL